MPTWAPSTLCWAPTVNWSQTHHTWVSDDTLTTSMDAGLEAPLWHVQTCPREVYPADIAVVAGSIAAHDRATGGDHSALLSDWSQRFATAAVDPASGMLYQALQTSDGQPADRPRGSWTAIAAYLLTDVEPELSAALYDALQVQHLARAGIRDPPSVNRDKETSTPDRSSWARASLRPALPSRGRGSTETPGRTSSWSGTRRCSVSQSRAGT